MSSAFRIIILMMYLIFVSVFGSMISTSTDAVTVVNSPLDRVVDGPTAILTEDQTTDSSGFLTNLKNVFTTFVQMSFLQFSFETDSPVAVSIAVLILFHLPVAWLLMEIFIAIKSGN